MALIETVLFVAILAYISYKWATKDFDIFDKRGIAYEKPLPLIGNSAPVIANKSSFFKLLVEYCERNKQHKVVGFFNFRQPAYIINDPECIKKLCIKDFDHFPNHRPFINSKREPLVLSMLTMMKDQRWKDMRNTLTPVFTAAKMRTMFSLMNECFEESLNYLHSQSMNGKPFELELKECFTRLSNDIIATTAFGLKLNSYKNRTNEFYSIGQSITNFRGKQMIKFFMSATFPWVMDLFKINVFDATKCNYFMSLVIDAMNYREEHKILRPDMIQLLIEAKKETENNWSDEELVGQCFTFFFAAFENNANLICTTCHELMENPDIQERLYEEVCDVQNELNGAVLSYDIANKMVYMDMVVSESLRKWSLAVVTDRVCAKDYKLYDDDGNYIVEFKPGDNLWIPISAIHMSDKYYENPSLFDPERFSEDNKKNLKPCTYLPFGVGPRNCIGNRYALMQAKAMLYYLVLNFKMERCAKTVKNLVDDIRGFQINPESGFWMRFVPRQ